MSETDVRQPSLKELAARCLGPASSLSPDLERRIRAMAQRWRYTPGDLAEVLDLAREQPEKWTQAVALDERREQEFRERGLLPRADA